MIVKNAIKMTENISGLEALDDGAKVDLILTLTWTLTLTLALTLTQTLALTLTLALALTLTLIQGGRDPRGDAAGDCRDAHAQRDGLAHWQEAR